VEAHTHEYIATAHEDQKFGFSSLGVVPQPRCSPARSIRGGLDRIHSHIGSQIFDAEGFEVAARVPCDCTLISRRRRALSWVRWIWVVASALLTPAPILRPRRRTIGGSSRHHRPRMLALGIAVPHLSIEPGRAISGPSTFALYRVGTVKPVTLDGGASRLYVAVDGGMSDNIRTALYAAEYSATLASRLSTAPPVLARVVGKHCEGGDILVRDEFLPADIAPGDLLAVPGSGAYSRSMASNYNHVPRPPVVAVRDGQISTLLRRETIEDLLALDAG
jgi:diaminopimelate decarboxylase